MAVRQLPVATILGTKARIQKDYDLAAWIGITLEGADFDRFAGTVRRKLPGDADYDAVRASLAHLAGQELTERVLDATLWRLLGNIRRLYRGLAVYPWSAQPSDEWVTVQIVNVERQIDQFNHLGADFVLQILRGTSCPLRLKKFWTRKFASVLSQRLGFTASWKRYPFRDVAEFMNLRLDVLIEAELSGKAPDFEQVRVTQSQLAYNRKYLRMRQRLANGFVCPRHYSSEQPCWRCPAGLNECPAAVRPKTLKPGPCKGCQNERAWWPEPRGKQKVCVECQWQQLIQRRKSS